MLMLATKFVDGFKIDGFFAAFIGAILLSIVNSILSRYDEEDRRLTRARTRGPDRL